MKTFYSDKKEDKETCWYCQWELNEDQQILADLDFNDTYYCNDKCAKDMHKENEDFAGRTEKVLLKYPKS